MLSNLGPLFKTMFRKAESADARLEIRREEKENPRKKPEKPVDDNEDSSLWDDKTEVSIAALHNFFVDFLRRNHAPVPVFTQENPDVSHEQPPQTVNASYSPAARAARAYGATASHGHSTAPAQAPNKQEETTDDLASLLSAEEIRTIHQLIAKLDRLGAGGLQTLTIVMEGSFLESVERALKDL